jgi:4-alpha-glucanotransferase
MILHPDHLAAGILEPVFAIRTENDLGSGDTDGVRQMIDWCHKHGLNIFQTLPVNETCDHHSPYDALSSMAIDPVTIAVSPKLIPDLPKQKFNRLARPKLLRELRKGPVQYKKARALKRELLAAAFDYFVDHHFNPGTARAQRFRDFINDNVSWLPDYSLYRVLMEENGGAPAWEKWLPEHRTPPQARAWMLSLTEKRRSALQRLQLFFVYVQWIAFTQWQAVKEYGDSKHVWLMGDIPFGVGRHSADVWANRAIFDLDWSGGAPPEFYFKGDPFVEKWGQNWGVPNYRWDELRRRDYAWWRTRIGNVQKIFHLYRIDHAPGFFRIYSFPWPPERNAEFAHLTQAQAAAKTGGRLPGFRPHPDNTAEHKAINQRQGEDILRVVLEASKNTVVVAEDLGVVPDYAPPTLRKLKIPGFRIPSFFREKDGCYENPAKYPRLSLAQPATHDHPPLVSAWADFWKHIDADHETASNLRELQHIMDFAGVDEEEIPREFDSHLHEGYMRSLLRSNSWMVVVMISDVFGLPIRFNTPGSTSPDNWSVRLPKTVKELDEDPAWLTKTETFARLAREAKRGPGKSQT